MNKLLVFTDAHITSEHETIIGLDMLARFQTTLAAAVRDHPDADALIIMGDLAHHGATEPYQRLKSALSDVPCPIIFMMGNHDRRDVFLDVFPEATQTTQGHIQTSVQIGDHRIITLDTLDGPPYTDGYHSGRLCEDRLAWLDRELAAAGDAQILVFAHHPPMITGIAGMDPIRLTNGSDLLDRLVAHGRCHLFCGHLHRTISGSTKGVPWTIFKSTGHQGPLDLINVDSSLSIDEPPAYGVVLLTADGVVAHSQDVIAGLQIDSDPGSSGP